MLKNALKTISSFKEVNVTAAGVTRRASVAVVLRFPDCSFKEGTTLESILETENLGKAEVLFIKRATRTSDYWSSHIALPGGRREESDANDIETAVRETREEVGLDLASSGIYVGPLDQQLVKVSWGSQAIMVLCPYIFVLTDNSAPLLLQQSEVAAAFWYPVDYLLDPATYGTEYVPIGDRMHLSSYKWIPKGLHSLIKSYVGNMLFSAISLSPPQVTIENNKILDWGNTRDQLKRRSSTLSAPVVPPPYKCWGLTLGIMVDFLEVLKPTHMLTHFTLPTMKKLDNRMIASFFSSNYERETKAAFVKSFPYKPGDMHFAPRLLEGYWPILRRSIYATVLFRLATYASLAAFFVRTYQVLTTN